MIQYIVSNDLLLEYIMNDAFVKYQLNNPWSLKRNKNSNNTFDKDQHQDSQHGIGKQSKL